MALHFSPAPIQSVISAILELSSLLPRLEKILRRVPQLEFLTGAGSSSRAQHSNETASPDWERIRSIAKQIELVQERLGRLDAAVSGLSREVADLSAASRTCSAQLERMEALLAAAERRLQHSNIAMLVVAAAAAAALVSAFVRK